MNLAPWLLRLIAWDGLLPVCVAVSPFAVGLIVPNQPGAIEVTAVLLPIAAFLIRFYFGRRHIAANHCAAVVRRFQLCAFCVGIFVLVMIDSLIILSHLMPPGALIATRTDRLICSVLALAYLTLMAFAMYPGQLPGDRTEPFLNATFGRFDGHAMNRRGGVDTNADP